MGKDDRLIEEAAADIAFGILGLLDAAGIAVPQRERLVNAMAGIGRKEIATLLVKRRELLALLHGAADGTN